MSDQRVDQGTGLLPARRVHDHAGRLVDDNNVIVLIDNLERDRLRLRLGRRRHRHVEVDRGA